MAIWTYMSYLGNISALCHKRPNSLSTRKSASYDGRDVERIILITPSRPLRNALSTSYDVRDARCAMLKTSKQLFERYLRRTRCLVHYINEVWSLLSKCTEHLLRRKRCSVHCVETSKQLFERFLQWKRCLEHYTKTAQPPFAKCIEHLLRRKRCSVHYIESVKTTLPTMGEMLSALYY